MRKQTKKWKMLSGQKIRICDMDDSHLENTINLLRRYAESENTRVVVGMLSVPPLSGEIAQEEFDKDLEFVLKSTWVDYVPKIYKSLVLEKERRKAMTCKRCGAEIKNYPCRVCGLKSQNDKGNVPLYNEEGLSNEEDENES